jgi:hypothetical protein
LTMKFLKILLPFIVLLPVYGFSQVSVNPTGVNVNASGSTVVFLTYGGLQNYVPAEALWCADIEDAFPDAGFRCRPGTIYGALPAAFNQSTLSGAGGFTDIMSIPASVARRAYQEAASGGIGTFFYVRRFESLIGGQDVYVAVTCRLAGGGARVPFSLVDVRISFSDEVPVATVMAGDELQPFFAEIRYNGTGQLQGRWEIVRPGDELPVIEDLLTEATLPAERRGLQRRYQEVERFSYFLPPSGDTYVLHGPDVKMLPSDVEGMYMILLRIEATDDKEGDSSLDAVGAGFGTVRSGGVAGFPIPPLRYYVGSTPRGMEASNTGGIQQLSPGTDAVWNPGQPIDFNWTEIAGGMYYQLEVEQVNGPVLFSSWLQPGIAAYRAPGWIMGQAHSDVLRWRVRALDADGRLLSRTAWRTMRRE